MNQSADTSAVAMAAVVLRRSVKVVSHVVAALTYGAYANFPNYRRVIQRLACSTKGKRLQARSSHSAQARARMALT
jgi:hypothetical protein